jgi:hypothetical protein
MPAALDQLSALQQAWRRRTTLIVAIADHGRLAQGSLTTR